MMHLGHRVEGEWFVRQRIDPSKGYGVYHRVGGEDILHTTFKTRFAADQYVAALGK